MRISLSLAFLLTAGCVYEDPDEPLTCDPSIVFAAEAMPGADDSERIQAAMDAAAPVAGTVLLGAQCTDCSCDTARIWTVDEQLWGPWGITVDGRADDETRSTLKLRDSTPEEWNTARWNDIIGFKEPAVDTEETTIRDVVFDGNSAGQGHRHLAACSDGCLSGEVCQTDPAFASSYQTCLPVSCVDTPASCEPKQEGVLVNPPDGVGHVTLLNTEFHDFHWVAVLAFNNSRIDMRGLYTTGNYNTLQLGGNHGHVELDVEGWVSQRDRVPYRGEIEGPPAADLVSIGRIEEAAIIDAGAFAFSYGGPPGDTGSQFVAQRVISACVDVPDCGTGAHLVPYGASVRLTEVDLGATPTDNPARSMWLQNVGGDVLVEDSHLQNFVHFHSVTPGFDPETEAVTFRNVAMTGAGGRDNYGFTTADRTFAFYTNQNQNVPGNGRLGVSRRLVLDNVDTSAMEANGLLHQYGGLAEVDHATLEAAGGRTIAIAGYTVLGYTSHLTHESCPSGGTCSWSTLDVTEQVIPDLALYP